MMRTAWLLSLTGLALMAACGSRSDLRTTSASASGSGGSGGAPSSSSSSTGSVVGGAGGTGGAGAGTTSSSTSTTSSSTGGITGGAAGSGGTGGQGPLCNQVTVAAQVITLEDSASDLTQPNLVTLDTQPPTAAIVLSRQALPSVTGPNVRVGAFAGWGSWPPPPPALVDMTDPQNAGALVPGTSIAATSLHASKGSQFALLFRDFAGVSTSLATSADVGGNLGASTQTSGGDAEFLASDPSMKQVMAGLVPKKGSFYSLDLLVTAPSSVAAFYQAGCADTPVVAAATGTKDGWLLFTALGTPLKNDGNGLDCPMKFSMIGQADTLDFARVDPSGYPTTVTQILQMPNTVARIRAARHGDGASVVWGLTSSSSLSGARVTPTPSVMSTFQILPTTGGLTADSFDVVSLGAAIVIGVVSQPSIQVVALDTAGTALWATSIPTDGVLDGPVHLLPSPDGSEILVAWPEVADTAAGRHRVKIARLDCVPSP